MALWALCILILLHLNAMDKDKMCDDERYQWAFIRKISHLLAF